MLGAMAETVFAATSPDSCQQALDSVNAMRPPTSFAKKVCRQDRRRVALHLPPSP